MGHRGAALGVAGVRSSPWPRHLCSQTCGQDRHDQSRDARQLCCILLAPTHRQRAWQAAWRPATKGATIRVSFHSSMQYVFGFADCCSYRQRFHCRPLHRTTGRRSPRAATRSGRSPSRSSQFSSTQIRASGCLASGASSTRPSATVSASCAPRYNRFY